MSMCSSNILPYEQILHGLALSTKLARVGNTEICDVRNIPLYLQDVAKGLKTSPSEAQNV